MCMRHAAGDTHHGSVFACRGERAAGCGSRTWYRSKARMLCRGCRALWMHALGSSPQRETQREAHAQSHEA